MSEWGRQVIVGTGIPINVSADGRPRWGPIGITVDWGLVTALTQSMYTSQAEMLLLQSGAKFLRYGQVLCEVTNAPVQTLTITGTPTGGTFVLAGYRLDTGAYVVTAPLAYNATAAAVLAALQDAAVFGMEAVTVTGAAGGPYTITGELGPLAVTPSLTGGATPSAAVAQTTPVSNTGMYGPFDPNAADGRQNIVRGRCGILNSTVVKDWPTPGIGTHATNHPPVMIGGLLWKQRVLAVNANASLAGGPLFSALEAALAVEWVASIGW